MSIYLDLKDEGGAYLVHKMGCPKMPPPHECRECADTADGKTALRNAKAQKPDLAERIELCPACW